jgi:hypothetical protein
VERRAGDREELGASDSRVSGEADGPTATRSTRRRAEGNLRASFFPEFFLELEIAGVIERERPKTDPESVEMYRREREERLREAKVQLRRGVERFRSHFGIERAPSNGRPMVVAMWRPDEDRAYFLDGRWAAESHVYYMDQIPAKSYGGQDHWPMPFFPIVADAVEYLGGSRPHTACQVGLEDFQRRWPLFKLVMPRASEPQR